MPSQEEYLDKLLQNMDEGSEEQEVESFGEIDMSDMDALLQSVIDSHEEEYGASEHVEAETEEMPELMETSFHLEDVLSEDAAPAVEEPADIASATSVEEMVSTDLEVAVEEPVYAESEVTMEEPIFTESEVTMEEPIFTESDVTMEEPVFTESDVTMEEPVFTESETTMEETLDTVDAVSEVDDEADVAMMSEDDIARLLEEASQVDAAINAEGTEEQSDEVQELNEMLEESDDAELKQIQELLQKSDNNEAIVDMPEDASMVFPVADIALEEPALASAMNEKQQKAEEKKRQKEAAKEAKKAAKEQKRAQKAAKKEEKATKKAKKSDKSVAKQDGQEVINFQEDMPAQEFVAEGDALLDALTESPEDMLAFDLFGDMSSEEEALQDTDIASEDALAQIIEGGMEKKEKKGLFTRIFDFLTEEDEEVPENESILLSDENENILREVDKEKGKGKKKKSKKKSAKEKAAEKSGENDENEDENQDQKGKGKKKKEKKPKKEKQPKEVKEEKPAKKLAKKPVILIFAACLSIAVAILVFVNIVGDYSVKQVAKQAYYKGDYQTCYQNLFGKDLTESEQVMYSKSESILAIRLWMSEYRMFSEEGQEVEALDSLIQSVYDYPTLYTYAQAWNADKEVAQFYAQLLQILSEKYCLTEAQAMEIANTPDDIEYTKMVMAIAQGKEFGSWNQPVEPEVKPQPVVLEDKLPEEGDIDDTSFVDNQ